MLIAGFDEVGRGAWAGPLVVAGVVLADGNYDFKDSKRYSKSARRAAALDVYRLAMRISIQVVPARELDQLGLAKALEWAFHRAADELSQADQLVFDGTVNYAPQVKGSIALPRAEDAYAAVAAASIVAKVVRDDFMAVAAKRHDAYGFESNVGYGTGHHRQALERHGVCSLHRLSFKPVGALS